MAQTILHKADSRGITDLGWLKSYQTFCFGNYYNPDRIHFGALRVLNDDIVDGDKGFGDHPHDNMEIISIPLEGELRHEDSMGNTAVIRPGEIQMMSAGTGIYHAEYNGNKDKPAKFLQIWLYPNQLNVEPRYDQIVLEKGKALNNLQQIVSPNKEDQGVWVYQNAWFYLANFEKGFAQNYSLHNEKNGVYIFVIKGSVEAANTLLEERDGLGILETDQLSIRAQNDAEFLLMEVSMTI